MADQSLELTVIARAKAKPGKEQDLEEAWRAVVAPSRREQGCHQYLLHRSTEDPAIFLSVEHWATQADLDAHMASAHIQELLRAVPFLVDGPPEISVSESLPEAG